MTPSTSGNVSKAAGRRATTEVDLVGGVELNLGGEITRLRGEVADYKARTLKAQWDNKYSNSINRQIGENTELLTEAVFSQNGWRTVDGGKDGSNSGFDHVNIARDSNGDTIIMVADSKPIEDSAFKLDSSSKMGTQLSDDWIDRVLKRLDSSSEAYELVSDAYHSGLLKRYTTEIDKKTNKFVIIEVADFN